MKPILERVGGSDQNNKKIKKIPIFLQTWSFYTKNAGQKKKERYKLFAKNKCSTKINVRQK